MKLTDIYTLTSLLTPYLDRPLPARAAFSIARFFASTENDLSLYSCMREQLIRKYSTEVNEENGALSFKIEAENLPAFEKEMGDLDNTEVEANLKLCYEDLDSLSLTPREVVKLLPYVE